MKIGTVTAAARFALVVLLAQSATGEAAEVKVLCANAMGLVMNELGPQFERATGPGGTWVSDLPNFTKPGCLLQGSADIGWMTFQKRRDQ